MLRYESPYLPWYSRETIMRQVEPGNSALGIAILLGCSVGICPCQLLSLLVANIFDQ